MINVKLNIDINYDEIDKFCSINDFVVIDDYELQNEGMFKNIVYATENNFVGVAVYPKNMPLIMNKDVWEKLKKVNNELKKAGKCITIYDSYRPIEVQKLFWEYFYNTHGYYDETLVANPNKYGTHNIKINAIDIMISNIDGSSIPLPCGFDDFTGKANIRYDNISEEAKKNRDLLINTCAKYGLIVNNDEWWHYYDERIQLYGMKYNFKESDLIPENEEKVFILK